MVDLGPVGVWWSGSWRPADQSDVDGGAELEALGYGALWSSGGFEPGLPSRFGRLLATTQHSAVATGIVSVWASPADSMATAANELEARFPGRFLLGIGASHSAVVPAYAKPYTKVVAYLDELDELAEPVPRERRVLAALGPRMLTLAAERAAGAHPYFVPVEHTAMARNVLGPGPLLAPEVAVVIESDPAQARALARAYASIYLPLPNYANNLRTLGYRDDDIDHGGSDRLIDAVIPWGDVETVARRLREHHEAGADHVCVQVVAEGLTLPLDGYRELASALGLS